MEEKKQIYQAGIYLRLSKEDGDKGESNSVQTQREIIQSFLKHKDDIAVVSEKIDDGFSGVSFDRPAFQSLMEEIRAGRVNCVIVKDLSRFGRNYLEAGKYIEQIFPFLGVRFIAVNDNIDTAQESAYENHIIVPFKNLLNDVYSRDISTKVRSQLEVRRTNGDFVGAFPVYGYRRSAENKHRLVIDEVAAKIVQEIFSLRFRGQNNQYIAHYLNGLGIPSPMAYKEGCGSKYTTSFQLNPQGKWSAVAIDRILKNKIYTGDLFQGKETTVSYKQKVRVIKPQKEWVKGKNTHEAIITKEDFDIVQRIMGNDTRTSPQKNGLYKLSGMLNCGACGNNMVRKCVKAGGKSYPYYICSKNKENKAECTSHRIREAMVEDAVTAFFQRTALLLELKFQKQECTFKGNQRRQTSIDALIQLQQEELSRNQSLLEYLYEDYHNHLFTKEEYLEMKQGYDEKCSDIEFALEALLEKKKVLSIDEAPCEKGKSGFYKKEAFSELDRGAVALFFEKVIVEDRNTIKILPRFRDEVLAQMQVIEEIN